MANEITVSEARLKELLDEVETELTKALSDEKGKLAKAAPGDEDALASASPASPDASASASPAASASPPPPAAEGSAASPEASGAAPAEAPGEMPAEETPGEGHEGSPSEDDLKQAYGQLDDESLKMHYMAIKAALFERMGAGEGASPDASASPAAGAPPAPAPNASPEMGKAEAQPDNSGGMLSEVAPTKAGKGPDRLDAVAPSKAGIGKDRLAAVAPSMAKDQMPYQKREMPGSPGSGGDALAPARKSEDELADLKKTVAEQETALGNLVGAVRTMLETPQRKAVTSAAEMAFVPRTATPEKSLSKSEILSKLNEKAKTPGLKKSDRDLINKFCVGAVDAKDIAHLLTE